MSSSNITRSTEQEQSSMMHRASSFLGFQKRYNFALFSVLTGALIGFTLARFSYLDFNGSLCAIPRSKALPGECFYYRAAARFRIGILLHLATILPAALLATAQFVPIIRRRFTLFHRINGYIIILLIIFSHAGALMITSYSFGGDLSVQASSGFLVLITTVSLVLSFWNIKKLRIDLHRAWMLRVWAYLSSIITMRLIAIIAATIISQDGGYFAARPCAQLASMLSPFQLNERYPSCRENLWDTNVVVHANMRSSRIEEVAVALGMPFGMAMWLSTVIHAIFVEVYLRLTPAENERLRQVSYTRQMEAGMREKESRSAAESDNDGDEFVDTPTINRVPT